MRTLSKRTKDETTIKWEEIGCLMTLSQ